MTGRSSDADIADGAAEAGTVEQTATAVAEVGGTGIGLVCDHTDDKVVEEVVACIRDEQGRIDVLVNNAWGGYERMVEEGEYTWELPFWEQPVWRWDAMFEAGVRACYSASRHVAPLMIVQGKGLIVNVSYWAAQKYMANVAYGVAKAATDRLTADMAHELRPHGVTAISLYPGLVRTERVMEAAEYLDLSNLAEIRQLSESNSL